MHHLSPLTSFPFSSAPPEFLIPVSDIACESGDSVTLRCKVCGRPRATVTWQGPDNNTLSNNRHYSITYRWQHVSWLSLMFEFKTQYTRSLHDEKHEVHHEALILRYLKFYEMFAVKWRKRLPLYPSLLLQWDRRGDSSYPGRVCWGQWCVHLCRHKCIRLCHLLCQPQSLRWESCHGVKHLTIHLCTH